MSDSLDPMKLTQAVGGDFAALAVVRKQPHEWIADARSRLPELAVSGAALVRVLEELRDGHISKEDAQAWASFVRRGYIAGRISFPVSPIDISYAQGIEDLVAGIISRLDELGDKIDGDIDNTEVAEMLASPRS
jgi:hypothetical protein